VQRDPLALDEHERVRVQEDAVVYQLGAPNLAQGAAGRRGVAGFAVDRVDGGVGKCGGFLLELLLPAVARRHAPRLNNCLLEG
jgi:hypothetical protein